MMIGGILEKGAMSQKDNRVLKVIGNNSHIQELIG